MPVSENLIKFEKNCCITAYMETDTLHYRVSESCFSTLKRLIKDYCSSNPKFFKDRPTVSPEVRLYYDIRDKISLEIRYNKKTKQFTFTFSQWKNWHSIRKVGLVTLYKNIVLEKEQILNLIK